MFQLTNSLNVKEIFLRKEFQSKIYWRTFFVAECWAQLHPRSVANWHLRINRVLNYSALCLLLHFFHFSTGSSIKSILIIFLRFSCQQGFSFAFTRAHCKSLRCSKYKSSWLGTNSRPSGNSQFSHWTLTVLANFKRIFIFPQQNVFFIH